MSPSVEKMQRQGRGFDPRQEQFALLKKGPKRAFLKKLVKKSFLEKSSAKRAFLKKLVKKSFLEKSSAKRAF
jgi:hypothetical protein